MKGRGGEWQREAGSEAPNGRGTFLGINIKIATWEERNTEDQERGNAGGLQDCKKRKDESYGFSQGMKGT